MVQTGLMHVLVAVFAPAALGALTLLLPKKQIAVRTLFALAGMLAAVAALVLLRTQHPGLGPGTGFTLAPSLGLNMTFNADGLGLFFGLLVSGIGSLIVIYARGYFGPDAASLYRFFPTLGFFATAMMGLVLCDNTIGMLVFWELTSLSSFLLIGWERDNPRAVRLAVQALATTGLGGMVLLGGLVALGVATGEWTFSGLVGAMESGGVAAGMMPWVFVLIFIGGATKSAQWPFHYWLPGAMAAPTPVSAFLHSATMVKAGVYLFARLYPAMHTLEWWGPVLTVVGAVTMLWGAFVALRSHEIKRIFAYTTVSQLGLLVCAYGLGAWEYIHDGHHQANLIWPVTQILNHAVYKAPLFIIAGAIIHATHKSLLPELKGLWRSHRVLALICLAGAYAMAGGPFTLSFTAKEAFLYQAYHAAKETPWVWGVAVMAVLTAACNVAIFVRLLTTFVAPSEATGHSEEHHERGLWAAGIWWPAAALVSIQFIGGIAPAWFGGVIGAVETHALYWDRLPGILSAIAHPSAPLGMSAAAIVLGVVVGVSPLLRRAWSDPHNALFPAADRVCESLGWRALSRLQNGNFRIYATLTFAALLFGIVSSVIYRPELAELPRIASLKGAGFGAASAAVITTVMICASALMLPMVRSRMNRVLVLGATGMAVTMMYLIYQAPDLAMTQLMFELISVMLFLLVLRMLPEEPKARPKGGRVGRAVFAGGMGLVVGFLVLHVAATPDFNPGDRLGDWFLAHSMGGLADTAGRGGGGLNTVNVVLVDHRGYDTLGEVTVLGITALAVLSLVGSAPARKIRAMLEHHPIEDEHERYHPDDPRAVNIGPQPTLQSSLFSTAMKLVLPLALLFAGYVFFKGHNEPGGGFIAGLTASVALAVFRMANGPESIKKILPIKPAPMAAMGLAVALFSALLPLLLGYDFMRSFLGNLPLPGGGSYHWASVALFDLGVMIVVIGVSVGIINRLTEELES